DRAAWPVPHPPPHLRPDPAHAVRRPAGRPAGGSGMKLALVHDWLNQMGGAENVIEAMVELYGAPVYTAMYSPERMPAAYRAWDIRTTWMDRLPGIYAHHQKYLPLYPLAWGGVDLSDYDVVLSNKSGFCHGVQT